MAQRTTQSTEFILYLLILVFALSLRSLFLGTAPLTEFEARSALPAHSLTNGGSTILGDQPGYVILTSPLFSLFGSSEFISRLLPALFGSVVVILPYFWRDVLGKRTALVLSVALALDPGMVAISRLASGHMIALSAAMISLTARRLSKPALSGVFFSIALIASPLIFFGLIPAVLAWVSFRPPVSSQSAAWREFLLSAAITLILGFTLFFRAPEGLNGIGATISSFFTSLVQAGIPVQEIGLVLLGYSLPALIFGLIGAVNAWRNNHSVGKIVSLFAAYSLLLVLIYPGRQAADLIWFVVAIWVLAAIQIAAYLLVPEKDLGVAFGEAALMLLLGIFFGIALTKLAAGFADFAIVAATTLGLALAATILIAFGWSRLGAGRGFVWSLLFFSLLIILSATSRFLRVEITDTNDLWTPGPAAGSERFLSQSLQDLSVLNQGLANDFAVDSRVESVALAWELRDLSTISQDDNLAPIVITEATDSQPEELSGYRGQSFAIYVQRAWSGWPENFFAWLFYRQGPTQPQQIILWARADLFPDSVLNVPAQQTQ